MISHTFFSYCLCSVDASLKNLDITPALRSAGVVEETIGLWRNRKTADFLSEVSMLHPAHFRAYSNIVNPQNLYGPHVGPDVPVPKNHEGSHGAWDTVVLHGNWFPMVLNFPLIFGPFFVMVKISPW